MGLADNPIRLDIPNLDIGGACVTISSPLEDTRGVLILPSDQALHEFADAIERRGTSRDPLSRVALRTPTGFLSLSYKGGKDIPEAVRRQVPGWVGASLVRMPILLRPVSVRAGCRGTLLSPSCGY